MSSKDKELLSIFKKTFILLESLGYLQKRIKVMQKVGGSQTLYHILLAAFCVILVISNVISAKLVQMPIFDLCLPAGLMTYPLAFLLSDLVAEFFGAKQARSMVYIALGMNVLAFILIEIALVLPSYDEKSSHAFQLVLGLSGLRVLASLLGYFCSQIVDIQLYLKIKSWTGLRYLWLRNNGSSCISQLVDTLIVDIIYLYWGLEMGMAVVFPIMLFSYLYKMFFSIAITPFFYLLVYLARKSQSMKFLEAFG